jgi:hypothetical protein
MPTHVYMMSQAEGNLVPFIPTNPKNSALLVTSFNPKSKLTPS